MRRIFQQSILIAFLIWIFNGTLQSAGPDADIHFQLLEKSVHAVAKYYHIPVERIHINIVHPPRLPETLSQDSEFNVKIKTADLRLGYQILWIVIRDAQARRHEFPMSVEIAINMPVCVAKHRIARGATIRPGDIEKKTIYLNRGRCETIAAAPEIIGLITRQTIRQSDIIRQNMVQVATPVNRGDRVAIMISRGALEIQMNGTVQNEARIGEEVRVRTADTGKILTGILCDSSLVMIK
jgi:flagella basal body P-ring formation protein FlgA